MRKIVGGEVNTKDTAQKGASAAISRMAATTMRIAVQNSWPNKTFSAEREFIARLKIAGERLGHAMIDVITSDDILAAAPDVVLVTHEFSPKLTRVPTLGLIWSPVAFLARDAERLRNILSYDGFLVATPSLRAYITRLLRTHGKCAPVSDFDFVPSAPETTWPDEAGKDRRSLFYAGVHWDGRRHGDLFTELRGCIPLRLYGDPARWGRDPDFDGALPFDGRSVVEAIRRCGIALCLHTPEHRAEGIPSMRLFEAAAAGAVIIADRLDYAVQSFGDTLLYIDEGNAATVARQIVDHVAWVEANPAAAAALAQRSHEVFRRRFTLETILGQLPDFVSQVVVAMGLAGSANEETVEIIMRVGSRPLEFVERAIASISAQTHGPIGLVIVAFRHMEGLESLLESYRARFVSIKLIQVEDDGWRSTALWAGLGAISAPYFGNLDDDDIIHPNHVSSMLATFERSAPTSPLVYAGTIQVEEDDGHWYDRINFHGDIDRTIEERRQLRFHEDFDSDRLLRLDNYIQSNAWMARRTTLTQEVLRDPKLQVGEDVFFYLMLLCHGAFVPSWFPTAEWNWRSGARDNSMFSRRAWDRNVQRLCEKLAEQGLVVVDAGAESRSFAGRRAAGVGMLRAVIRLFADRARFSLRVRSAIGLLRAGSGRHLLKLILRFGRR